MYSVVSLFFTWTRYLNYRITTESKCNDLNLRNGRLKLNIFKLRFLKNEILKKNIFFHIFDLFFHVESPCTQLYHQLRATLYNNKTSYVSRQV